MGALAAHATAEWTRTEEDAVELRGALVDVRQEDAAGLEDGQELCRAWRRERGEERVLHLCYLEREGSCVLDLEPLRAWPSSALPALPARLTPPSTQLHTCLAKLNLNAELSPARG